MEHAESVGLILGVCVASGLGAYLVADLLKIPAILFYLLLGLFFGPLGIDVMPQQQVQAALPHVVPLVAAIILFEGGLSLDIDAIRHATRPLQRILTLGATINLLGGTLAAWGIAGLPIGPSLIFGALMTVTGPTVILPILRRTPLVPRVRALLHWEAILIDPIGVVLGVLTLSFVVDGGEISAVGRLLSQLLYGSAAGLVVGLGASWMLRHRFFRFGGERANLAALSSAVVAFALGEWIVMEGGIVAATVAGLVMGTQNVPHLEHIREFKEQVTTVLVATLFVVLAAAVDPQHTIDLGLRGVLAVALVAFVVRPIAIFGCTAGAPMRWQEKAAIAWIGPRGIIAAAVASLAAIRMNEVGVEGGDALQGLVFGAIGGTVVVQGLSAGVVARLLGVIDKETGGVLLFAGPLGPALGKALDDEGVSVVLVDEGDVFVEEARAMGLRAQHGSLLDRSFVEHCYDQCELELMVAMTPEPLLNTSAAAVASEVLGPDRVYRAAVSHNGKVSVPSYGGADRVAFLGPLDIERVAEDVRNQRVFVGRTELRAGGTFQEPGGRFPLFIVRDGAARVVVPGCVYQPGDVLIFFERESAMTSEGDSTMTSDIEALRVLGEL